MNSFQGEIVLVTGAAGSIGSALSIKLAKLGVGQLILLDNNETGLFDIYEEAKELLDKVEFVLCDIKDKNSLEEVFEKYLPDVVFHVAAYKHVFILENFPNEAEQNNVIGTHNVAKLAGKYDVDKFILISSDKAVNPSSIMGMSKFNAEKIIQSLGEEYNTYTDFITVRFGNVMPSRGSVVPVFQKRISENKDLEVTSPQMRRYFMGIYDAVDLILKAAEIGKNRDIIILDMGEQIYIKDLAKMMIKLSGKNLGINYTKPGKGEKYEEQLMTKHERSRMIKKDNLFIIPYEKTNKKDKSKNKRSKAKKN